MDYVAPPFVADEPEREEETAEALELRRAEVQAAHERAVMVDEMRWQMAEQRYRARQETEQAAEVAEAEQVVELQPQQRPEEMAMLAPAPA